MNLASKYRPHTFEDVTEQSAVVDILKKICQDSEMSNRNYLFIGPAGTGKAQPMDSQVLTPSGYIKMRDVTVGTKVLDGKGEVTTVTHVYPQGVRPCYKIAFEDGCSIAVADNHLNVVTERDIQQGSIENKVMTTSEMIEHADLSLNSGVFYYIPIANIPGNSSQYTSFIDPYFVGAFAAEGVLQDNTMLFRAIHLESLAQLASILSRDWNCYLKACVVNDQQYYKVVGAQSGSAKSFSAASLLREFRRYFSELCIDNRKLPDDCILWKASIREQVLAGLRCNSDSGCFVTPHSRLSEQYTSIMNSLGRQDSTGSKLEYVDGKLTHIAIHSPSAVMSSCRQVSYIAPLGEMECQCIMVESSEHTYITDHFAVTHNTTLGRIIASELNGGPNGIIEIDAASHSGADAARDITNQARAYPIGTKWKCFVIDECHAISSQGWQVLLKTLEESPAKSIFVLCTTNPEKIPRTILSRVQTFQLSKISVDGVTKRLKHICDCEIAEGARLTYEEPALRYIAKLGNGGMRDSIQLLDRAIAHSKDITLDNLAVALDLPNYDTYFDLLNGIAKKNNEVIVKIINDVYDSGTNFVKWFEGFHSFVCQIVKYIYLQDINNTMIPAYYQDKIANYGGTHAVLCLRLANTLLQLNHALKSTNYLQEVAITYLCSSAKR